MTTTPTLTIMVMVGGLMQEEVVVGGEGIEVAVVFVARELVERE